VGPAREIPTFLLHYRVLSKLGEGGMGAVYKAEDTKLGRTVAIKVIATASGEEDSARERLLREARAASGLSHPSIVTIFAVEHVEERDFIVMELVEGTPLDVLLSRGPLEMARVLALGADVAEALDCAHAAGIVHRDIKPANIVVTPRGRAKVLDFGVAKYTAVSLGGATDATMPAPLTGMGVVIGTVPYMSPEQMRGEALDGRSDLFALGCVLYEAATGRRAFGAQEVMAVVHAVLNVDPPAPSTVASSVPAAFDAVLRRALAKHRAHRFESAAGFAAALRALATGSVAVGVDSSRSAAEAILVGRGVEVARLASCFDRAAAGEGSLVLVTGDAGIGKSAVVEGLLGRAGSMERLPLVGRGTCVEQFGAGEAYLPVLSMLDGLLAGRDGALVRETLRAVAPTWALQLRGAHDPGDEALRREAATGAKDAMVRELGEFIATVAASMPLLLVIEDAHWADPSTVSVLTYLAHRLRAQRALLVITARAREIEEQGHPLRPTLLEWRAKRTVDEVALGELSLRDVTSWLDARFPGNCFAEGRPPFTLARRATRSMSPAW
jgi:predicted Ser/Thr protein kinase